MTNDIWFFDSISLLIPPAPPWLHPTFLHPLFLESSKWQIVSGEINILNSIVGQLLAMLSSVTRRITTACDLSVCHVCRQGGHTFAV